MQTLAAGDWRYYRFYLPTNAPTNWAFTFQQHIGDVSDLRIHRGPPRDTGPIRQHVPVFEKISNALMHLFFMTKAGGPAEYIAIA